MPELQVLIEIFIFTVSRDFSRQIDSILSAASTAGDNNNEEVVLGQVARSAIDAAGAGNFSLNLVSPIDELDSVLNFIESNQLGRVVSSPKTLAATGQYAVVKRDLIARVPGPKMLDADDRSVDGSPLEYGAPFDIEIKKVDINRLDNKVKLDIELTDPRVNATPERVNELSDKTSDVIDTVFLGSAR